jgi:transposase
MRAGYPRRLARKLRDLVRCRDDVRRARTAARHQLARQLLRHGRIYREGKKAWTKQHVAWVRRQMLDHPLAQLALEHARAHLDSLDAQLAALDAERLGITCRGRRRATAPANWTCSTSGR